MSSQILRHYMDSKLQEKGMNIETRDMVKKVIDEFVNEINSKLISSIIGSIPAGSYTPHTTVDCGKKPKTGRSKKQINHLLNQAIATSKNPDTTAKIDELINQYAPNGLKLGKPSKFTEKTKQFYEMCIENNAMTGPYNSIDEFKTAVENMNFPGYRAIQGATILKWFIENNTDLLNAIQKYLDKLNGETSDVSGTTTSSKTSTDVPPVKKPGKITPTQSSTPVVNNEVVRPSAPSLVTALVKYAQTIGKLKWLAEIVNITDKPTAISVAREFKKQFSDYKEILYKYLDEVDNYPPMNKEESHKWYDVHFDEIISQFHQDKEDEIETHKDKKTIISGSNGRIPRKRASNDDDDDDDDLSVISIS